MVDCISLLPVSHHFGRDVSAAAVAAHDNPLDAMIRAALPVHGHKQLYHSIKNVAFTACLDGYSRREA
jgi:hypothetical protein